jgi:16S rRNA C967 or C1407 C5-methylase (RsmB/RsmF family)/NOL1/NOP2/fmu family ribosome biogenesis protein
MSAPRDFLRKMQRLLGAEYAAFAASLAEPGQVGLRVNTLKLSAEDFSRISPFTLTAVGAYEPAGFLVTDESRPGRHPYHAAGLYYLQEPAAMVVGATLAAMLRARRGADDGPPWALDLAAAPGGKATHLAARLGDAGLLVANDVHRGRAQILAENLERWGARQALILNDAPARLADHFGPVFDAVLLDAPCSGEGLFRRRGAFDWSNEIVAACAHRQDGILESAARLTRPGGLLGYATCTFAPEENEQVIARFLAARPDFSLLEPPRHPSFDHGQPEWVGEDGLPAAQRPFLARAIRLWPHRFAGEGHFIALLQRAEQGAETKRPVRLVKADRSAAEINLWRDFAARFLGAEWPAERLHAANGQVYLLPPDAPATGALRLARYGLLLGAVRKGVFYPAHTLALALNPAEARLTADWPADSLEIQRYLAGHSLASPGPDGWTLVTVDGFGLGWGKRVNGRLKNHYPRGLRRNLP